MFSSVMYCGLTATQIALAIASIVSFALALLLPSKTAQVAEIVEDDNDRIAPKLAKAKVVGCENGATVLRPIDPDYVDGHCGEFEIVAIIDNDSNC